MSDAVDVAVVGAGPYGLSVTAHLRGAGLRVQEFGTPMYLWRSQMPRGMYLKSQGFASNLSDPDGTHTLGEFCRQTGRPYAGYGLPVPIETFVAYGDWFAQERCSGLDQTLVTGIAGRQGGFELGLADGRTVTASRVVLAAGVEHFAHTPHRIAGLAGVTHSSAVTEPSDYAGLRVAVVGRGQSALETAALLQEAGADTQIITRSPQVRWNGPPLLPDRPVWQRMREPEAGLGSGWGTWFYSRHPELFRLLPEQTRIRRARTALGPAGASWLRERVEGKVGIRTDEVVASVRDTGGELTVETVSGTGERSRVPADRVIAATGYRPDLRRLGFLDDQMLAGIQTVAGTAAVDAAYQTSVPGLFMIGPAVAPVFGPVMRFVYGSAHAASTVARRIAATGTASAPALSPSLAGVAGR